MGWDEARPRRAAGGPVTRRRKALPGWTAAVAALLIALGPRGASAATIRVSGTGGAIATIRILAAEFERAHPDARVVVMPSIGSTGAIRAVLDGDLDIGLTSRPANSAECTRGCVARAYARTPFVFAVNREVAATRMTLAEAADIFAGKTTRWENGSRLRLVMRPAGETDLELLKTMSPAMRVAVEAAQHREGLIVALTDQDTADALERTSGAFGALSLSLILSEKRGIRVLALDGVVPGVRTLKDGSYPHTKTYYAVTKRNTTPVVRQFVDFVRSPAAKAVLEKNGQAAVR